MYYNMSYPSGAQKRQEEKAKCLRAYPKLTTFFTQQEAQAERVGESSTSSPPSALNFEEVAETEKTVEAGSEDIEETQDPQGESLEINQVLPDDPALWPERISDDQRCEIVKTDPKQILDIEFPQNNDTVP
ncbi:hypothetical protein EOD39_21314 [Acipenser ruthenus]|uniref:Uncharacterized protein n=1 Tax=Acipenser ruthenus TaxID=7906 RepID=A0A444UT09_ACIRT|nr:hypothetical protein EOD39_21314 [Acipenser ruthenus]